MLEIISVLITIAAYFVYKSEEEEKGRGKKASGIDNEQLAFETSHGIAHRKRRLTTR